jgi:dolichol-phosphate mannosyltransferase
MTVTVVIPAYNEGLAFGAALVCVAEYFSKHGRPGDEFEFLIVDDGSSDETLVVAEAFARWRKNVRILRHERNRGLGAALRTAFAEVRTQAAVVLDADLSYEPATALALIEALDREDADIALASAYAAGGAVRNVPMLRRVLSREANRLLSLATCGKYATLTCMVRAYRRSALPRLEFTSDGMDSIAEMLFSAIRQGMRVVEISATLQWTHERRTARRPFRISGMVRRICATTGLAFRHRPALWLGVPGLLPGVLPLVVAILLILHVSTKTLAIGTTATIVVQYTSLALLGGQLTAFFGRRFYLRRRSNGVTAHGYNLPNRTA